MLQFIELYCIESNVAHKVQRYINLFVASELVSDVLGFILGGTHVASTNKRLIRPATNLGFPLHSKLQDI